MSILEDILSAYNTPDFKHKLARILPDDENSLGNIYTELNNFNPQINPSSIQQHKNMKKHRSQSLKKLPRKTPLSIAIEDSKNLIALLRQKKLKYVDAHLPINEQLKIMQLNKITSPLKKTPSAKIFHKRTKSDYLLSRYRLNQQFYEREQFKEHIDQEMINFTKLKSQTLDNVIHNKLTMEETWKSQMRRRFSNVKSKLLQYENKDLNEKNTNSQWLSKSQGLQEMITSHQSKASELSRQKFFPKIKNNIQKPDRLESTVDYSLVEQGKQISLENKEAKNEERYTSVYIRMIRRKMEKKGLSKYQKDLRKDEIRMKKLKAV